jgi:hypothetical protein
MMYSNMLWAGRFLGLNPGEVGFSGPTQTGPQAQLAACTMGTGCLFLEVKQLGSWH